MWMIFYLKLIQLWHFAMVHISSKICWFLLISKEAIVMTSTKVG